jgi:GDP-L-fucose synthase
MKTILVTGGNGFLGKHVMARLTAAGYDAVTYSSEECDFTNPVDIRCVLRILNPDTVIHLAAKCGGIGANKERPAEFFYENLKMGMELIHEAHLAGVDKFVQVGTVCAYPKFTPVPFKEEDLWNGYPEETNAPYGIAKKALLVQCQAYREQYGMNAIYVVPVNLYGPHDNFDINTSHVIPALIKKCVEAKATNAPFIEVWGTGVASREFLYVEDCAEAIVAATEKYNGQPRRCLDVTKAVDTFGFKAKTGFADGLRKTVEWYVETLDLNKQLPVLRGSRFEPTTPRDVACRGFQAWDRL